MGRVMFLNGCLLVSNILKRTLIPRSRLIIAVPNDPSYVSLQLRATSHMRLRAHDHYTSSTLIGGKGGVGPSSLHTTLEGPTEYVNARSM